MVSYAEELERNEGKGNKEGRQMRGKIACALTPWDSKRSTDCAQMGSDCAWRIELYGQVCVCVRVCELDAPVSGTDTQAWRR